MNYGLEMLLLGWAIGFACGAIAGRIMAAALVVENKQQKTANECLAAEVGKLSERVTESTETRHAP